MWESSSLSASCSAEGLSIEAMVFASSFRL
jgi:hypothetical protein